MCIMSFIDETISHPFAADARMCKGRSYYMGGGYRPAGDLYEEFPCSCELGLLRAAVSVETKVMRSVCLG